MTGTFSSIVNANPRDVLITGFDKDIDVGPIVAFRIIGKDGEIMDSSSGANVSKFALYQKPNAMSPEVEITHKISKIFDGFDTGELHWIYADRLVIGAGFLDNNYAIEIIFPVEG